MVTPSPFPSSAVARALGFGALDFTNPSGVRALREGYARCVASEGYVGNPEAAQGARDAAERFVAGVLPVIESIKQASVVSAQGIARELNAWQVLTARGGKWNAASVINVMRRRSNSAATPLPTRRD